MPSPRTGRQGDRQIRRRRYLLICLSPCLLLFLGAAEPLPDTFVLDAASGKSLAGPLVALTADGGVRLGGAGGGSVPGAEVVCLRRTGTPLPPLPRGEHVLFANGDRLPAKVGKLVGQRLRAEFAGQTLEIPLASVAALWKAPPEGPEAEDVGRLLRRLADGARTSDLVLLRNGDSVEGIVTGLDEATVTVDAGKKSLPVARSKVAAVAFNTELATAARPRTRTYRVLLRDGTRLSLASATWAGCAPLAGVTLFKAPVSIPADEVVALYVHGGAAVYLSDLKPRRADYASFGGDAWPFVADGGVDGRELRLDGSTYDKGLGTHSETKLTYDLAGRYRRFEALVGLAPGNPRGSARVRVLVDGKPHALPAVGELTARTKPIPVRVETPGARELTLVVDFGAGGPVQGRVNWADARLIR